VDTQLEDVMSLYERSVSGVIEYLQKQMKPKARCGIFTAPVVIWLMIRQRLQPRRTLEVGVESLIAGEADRLLSPCKRTRQRRFSHRTGGYSHARQRLPKLLCRQVLIELTTRLREILKPAGGPRAYILDGSSLELEASPGLRKLYPPAENDRVRGHWPILRLVVLHEAETGLAETPHWGAMYGAEAVSEQQLAEQAMLALEAGSILIGDRNFGIFSTAWAARQRNLEVIIRLQNERAHKVAGGPIASEGERTVCWKPSRFDGRTRGGMPPEASLSGRLISVRIGRGKSQEWLHVFTTLELPQQEVLALYGKRWNIETDLRSLKRTVGLNHIAARNESMMEKEVLTAMAAYNLVRAVMALAAHRHRLSPRQLSFTFVLNVVNARWPRLQAATDAEAYRGEVHDMIDAAAQGRHPKRSKRRNFPRAVWGHGFHFPLRKAKGPNA
jgi:DDE family transposase